MFYLKAIPIFAFLGLFFVLLTVVPVAVLNFSPKFVWPIVVALLGLVGAWIVTLSQLKGDQTTERKSAVLVFDQQDGLPLHLHPSRAPEDLSEMYAVLRYFMDASGVRSPQDRSEANFRGDGAALIELLLLWDMFQVQSRGVEMVQSPDHTEVPRFGITFMGDEVPEPPDAQSLPCSRILKGPYDNRAAMPIIHNFPCVVPKGTTLESRVRNQTRELVFRKPLFFDLVLSVRPMTSKVGSFPVQYKPMGSERPVLCSYEVTATRHFERYTSQNPKTDALKAWSAALIRELFKRLPY